MALVAPECVRYTINGRYLTRPAVNVLDMVVQPNDNSIISRNDAIPIVAGVIIDAWADTVMSRFNSSYTFDSVSYVDLNDPNGPVGEVTQTDFISLPQQATGNGEPLTAALAMLVTKETQRQRGSRPGRWFLPAFTEGDIAGNIWINSTLVATNDELSDFLERVTETGIIQDINQFPTVIHTRNAGTPQNPVIQYVNNTQITGLQAQGRVSTQRRRNRP